MSGDHSIVRDSILKALSSKWTILLIVGGCCFLDMFITSAAVPLLPELVRTANKKRDFASNISAAGTDRSENAATLQAMVFSAYAVGFLLATPIVGVICDQMIGRKGLIVFGSFGLTVVAFLMANEIFNVPELIGVRLIHGVASAVSWTGGMSMLSEVFHKRDLSRAIGISISIGMGGELAGFLSGGIMGAIFGIRGPFSIAIIFGAVIFIIGLCARPRVAGPRRVYPLQEDIGGASAHEMRANAHSYRRSSPGMLGLMRDAHIAMGMVVITTVAAADSAFEALMPGWAEEVWRLGPISVSAALVSNCAPQVLLGPLLYGWGGLGSRSAGLLLMGVFLAGVIPRAVRWVSEVIPASLMLGIASALAQGPVYGMILERMGKRGWESHGRLYALGNCSYAVGTAIGPWIAGSVRAIVGGMKAARIESLAASLGVLRGPFHVAQLHAHTGVAASFLIIGGVCLLFAPIDIIVHTLA
jgi:DHA1 family solute carrier family 18 vesicular amine transporter 1/2